MTNLFPPDFGPPFRNNPIVPALLGDPIRLARARLEEKWSACSIAKATLLTWSLRTDGENNVFPANRIGIILRDPIGQINWELAALQDTDGTFYLEAGLDLVVWLPEDSTDGHWELVSVGSGCPIESESESEGSESESEEESESESEGSESESESESEVCVNEIDFFGVTLPVITNPEYVLGKDANGCLGWVRGWCGRAGCKQSYTVRFMNVEPLYSPCNVGETACDDYFDVTSFLLLLDSSELENCHYRHDLPLGDSPCIGAYGGAGWIELTIYLHYAELVIHPNALDVDVVFRKNFDEDGLCSATGTYTLYNSPATIICDWSNATAEVTG